MLPQKFPNTKIHTVDIIPQLIIGVILNVCEGVI